MQISNLKTLAIPSLNDVLPILDINGGVSGKPVLRKVTIQSIFDLLPSTPNGNQGSGGFTIPTAIKTVADSGDFFIGIDDKTGELYKISKSDLLAGLPSGIGTGTGGTSLLLDNALNVISARSIRKLKTSYTGKIIKAILNNGTTQDIGSSANALDTSALLSFAGGGNAFVSKIYDQISAFDVAQSSISSCPKIIDNGTIIAAANRPTLAFNNSFLSGAIPCGYPITIIAAIKIGNPINGAFIKCGNDNGGIGIGCGSGTFDNPGTNLIGLNEVVAWIGSNTPIPISQMSIVEINSTGSSTNIYLNGVLVVSGGSSYPASGTYNIGGYSNRFANCNISEDIVFNTIIDSTTRSAIVANMKNYYNIS